MKKSLLLFILAIFIFSIASADPVDKDQAAKIARNFCLNSSMNKNLAAADLSLAYTEKSIPGPDMQKQGVQEIPMFYIFNVNHDNGFVMVAADNDVTPVLGYSTSGSYTGKDVPEALKKLMELYKEQIRYVVVNQLKASSEIHVRWENLDKGQPMNSSKGIKTVSPLCSTTWNQNPYENQMCPADPAGPGGHCVTGCPATAMGQIMKFWNFPTNGTGFHSYNASNSNGNYGTLSADYGGTTYDWASMPNNLTGYNDAVALLMLHCGIAVEMNYGPNGSGGWVIENDQNGNHPACCELAFKNYFGYASTIQGLQRQGYSDDQWKQMLMTDLDAGRPIQYAGWGSGGHTFVCDGYDQNTFFNMNWGWGGSYNGFYDLDALNPGTEYFNSNQQALLGIQPGQSGGTTSLQLYSSITVTPSTINFGDGFTVNADIVNNGSAKFLGDFCAALFTSDGTFVDYIQTLTGADLDPGYHYTNGLDFTTSGINAATPGQYLVGIYSRPTGGGWTLVGNGSYSNLISITISGSTNVISLYNNIVVDHSIVVNQPFTATTQIANYGSTDFNGYVSLDLHASDGTWIQAIQEYTNVTLAAGYYYNFTFSTTGLNVPPGEYYLVVWDQATGGSMELVGGGSYSNPITVVVSGQPLSPDGFEPDDTEAAARQLTVSFIGNAATCNTDGSNIHSSVDEDYYKLTLPSGFTYTINARLHDSYNSGNGQVYTADVMFSYKFGTKWSDTYDDEMPSNIVLLDGGTLTFNVFPYFPGEIGTYLLALHVEKNATGIETSSGSGNVKIYPNPAQDFINFQIDLKQPEIISGKITNLFGQQVMEIQKTSCEAGKNNKKIDVSSLPSGYYLYEIETRNGKESGKFVIAK